MFRRIKVLTLGFRHGTERSLLCSCFAILFALGCWGLAIDGTYESAAISQGSPLTLEFRGPTCFCPMACGDSCLKEITLTFSKTGT